MRRTYIVTALCLIVACNGSTSQGNDAAEAGVDGSSQADGSTQGVDGPSPDDAMVVDPLSAQRDRLIAGYAGTNDVCPVWSALDDSQRAVFLTLSHRLFISSTPDGFSMLHHMAALHLILGGGADGTACGGSENNRLFLSMDTYLWQLMVDTWNDILSVGDGADGSWAHTGDLAGPHDPFTASNETETGLRCALLIELPSSVPPTAQAHFFLANDQVPVQRGPGIDLVAEQYMFEIDHDFDCLHQSNPLCPGRSFAQKYINNYGDYGSDWAPTGCSS